MVIPILRRQHLYIESFPSSIWDKEINHMKNNQPLTVTCVESVSCKDFISSILMVLHDNNIFSSTLTVLCPKLPWCKELYRKNIVKSNISCRTQPDLCPSGWARTGWILCRHVRDDCWLEECHKEWRAYRSGRNMLLEGLLGPTEKKKPNPSRNRDRGCRSINWNRSWLRWVSP